MQQSQQEPLVQAHPDIQLESKADSAPSKKGVAPPTTKEQEPEVKQMIAYLSGLNRQQRRDTCAFASSEAGKLRRWMITKDSTQKK